MATRKVRRNGWKKGDIIRVQHVSRMIARRRVRLLPAKSIVKQTVTAWLTHRRSQDFLGGVHPPPLQKVDDIFLVVAIKTQATTTKLTTPTVQISNFALKNRLLLCLGVHILPGVHLQLFPVTLAPNFFFFTVGAHVHPVHPLATPMDSPSSGYYMTSTICQQ